MIERLNENELRAYPLAEDTLRVSDGVTLPDGLLADMRILTDRSYGRLYLSQVRVTPAMVSVAICAADGTGVAAALVTRPVTYGTAVALQPLAPLTSGYVIFGRGLETLDSLLFISDSVDVSGVDPAAVTPVDGTVVESFSNLGVDYAAYKARGLVALEVQEPLTWRYSGGIIWLGLNSANISDFLGPCDRADIDGNCGRVPIRSINGACPTADGVITLEVRSD